MALPRDTTWLWNTKSLTVRMIEDHFPGSNASTASTDWDNERDYDLSSDTTEDLNCCSDDQLWDHVEREYLGCFDAADEVPCPGVPCKSENFVLPSMMAFKRHCEDFHKISLRP
jgi:hypothetical protein